MMTFRQWMMQMARQYGRHYVVALFMCCLLFPLLFSGYDIVRDTVIISSGFTVAVAIFQFRFLYQRNAAIFMMGVPLKRRQLFHYCWFSGWLALLPIAAINGGCAAVDDMSGISAILASILYQTLNYAITVFFVSRSRRLLDAVLIGFGWLLALFLLQQSFLSFFNDRSQFFIQADAYNITNMQLQTALSFVSLLSLGGMYFRGNTGLLMTASWLWWILLAIAAFYWSRRSFEQLKCETCGSPSRSYAVYPFLLLVVTMSLLNLISLNEWTLFLIVMIFLLYMSVYFLYKRRIRFTFHMAAGFALLAAMEAAISAVFVYTNGLGIVQESPRSGFIQMELYAPVDSVLSEENQQKLAEVNTRYGKELQENEVISEFIVTFAPESVSYERMRQLQQQMMEDAGSQEDGVSDYYLNMSLSFINRIGLESEFSYDIDSQENYDRYMGELFDLLLDPQADAGVEIGYYDTGGDFYAVYDTISDEEEVQ